MHRRLIGAACAPVALGLALSGSASAATPPPSASQLSGDELPAGPAVPLRVEGATVEHRRLAVSVSCGQDGSVRVRGVGRAAFDCANGKAVARLRVAGRLRGGKLRIDARAGSMKVTRTLRPSAARARLAAPTIVLNAGTQWVPLGCNNFSRLLRTSSGWANWFGTTRACSFQLFADEYANGTQDDYYYWSTAGTWVLYRIRQCGPGSGYCWWQWVRPGF